MRGQQILLTRLALVVGAVILPSGSPSAQTVTPPPAGPLRPYIFPAVEEFQLANGLRVILVQKHTVPVVEGRLILDAGAMREPAAKNGLASLTWNSGKQLRRLQTGHIQSYLFGALGGAIAFVIIQYVIR